ncbi:MAG: carbohydrate-binding protein [Puia sp.]|nr:carbohydrate-binding protein [Puia sp.]
MNRMTKWGLLVGICVLSNGILQAQQLAIYLPANPTSMEDYAGKELGRYIYQLSGRVPHVVNVPGDGSRADGANGAGFLLGRPGHNALIDRLIREGRLSCKPGNPGPQGYTLKKLTIDGRETVVIAANDETGVLYGVYGLLEEHLGVQFSFEGDVLPEKKAFAETPPARLSALLPDLDETRTPAVEIRGLLPWTNFPQSATSYSWEDWKYILDQMAKMRLNFLHIHNYSGEEGHNEMFHNFEVDGRLSRVWMATARSGHAWGSYPGWDVNKYCFGSAELFDDYDFGADCALHNERLDNRQVFRKGVNEFQRVIAYAHSRGIRIGLGLDINLIPDSYQMSPEDPKVVEARVKQIETDYPALDYLLCFQSEGLGDPAAVKERAIWRKIFDGFYSGLKKTMPGLRLAVAGWGIRAEDVASLPPDVICAPISYYSDGCESGSVYGNREYWGCPWLERDFNSSVYYYPYNMNLSNTIKAWQERAPNMKGFYALTWRITDAVKARIGFLSRAPWDTKNELNGSEVLYRKFAQQQYGPAAAALVTPIINENEPFASDFSECRWTPPFSLARVERGGYLFNLQSFRPQNANMAIPAVQYAVQNSTQNAAGAEGKECVGYISPGSWLAYDNVSFDPSCKLYHFTIASVSNAGRVELRLDEPQGQKIGEGLVPSTGGWQNWKEISVDIQPVSGRHRLYLLFSERDPAPLAQAQLDKAIEQLSTIDEAISKTEDPGEQYRLKLLRSRIAAERDHIVLNLYAGRGRKDINELTRSWVGNFNSRVTDISSLGNVVSVQDRFIQKDYIDLAWKQLNTYNTLAPENVEARGTRQGTVINWKAGDSLYRGFDIYRDGKKITASPLAAGARQYEDTANGLHRYEVYCLFWGNDSSNGSVAVTAVGGDADKMPPQIVVISPPTSVLAGQPAWIKARLLDNRSNELLSATLYYRRPGETSWTELPMARRIKSTFTGVIPANKITADGIEYYISASDGDNEGVFPADAPGKPLSLIQEVPPVPASAPVAPARTLASAESHELQNSAGPNRSAGSTRSVMKRPDDRAIPTPPAAPKLVEAGGVLKWEPVEGASYYRIYRSAAKDFTTGPADFRTGPATLLTYLAAGAGLNFSDNGTDLQGGPLEGDWYYRVTAVDKEGYESPASAVVTIPYH